MLNYVITQNNQTINNIENAIKHYKSAYDIIKRSNDHPATKDILSLINIEIGKLEKIRGNSVSLSIQLKKNGSDSK